MRSPFENVDANSYHAFRPPYPQSCMDAIFKSLGEGPKVIADLGAGTGLLSLPLCARGHEVYHVDISAAMNDKARRNHAQSGASGGGALHIVTADAANTRLPQHLADAVIIGNGAHWMIENDYAASYTEMRRIGKPGAKILVAYHKADLKEPKTSAIFHELNNIFPAKLEPGTQARNHLEPDKNAVAFVDPIGMSVHHERQVWNMTREEFIGHVSTMSYAVKDGMTEERCAQLGALFDRMAADTPEGKRLAVTFSTDLFCGQLLPEPYAVRIAKNLQQDRGGNTHARP